jgi:hypothetical protein
MCHYLEPEKLLIFVIDIGGYGTSTIFLAYFL